MEVVFLQHCFFADVVRIIRVLDLVQRHYDLPHFKKCQVKACSILFSNNNIFWFASFCFSVQNHSLISTAMGREKQVFTVLNRKMIKRVSEPGYFLVTRRVKNIPLDDNALLI